jgi:hypothetical protein
MQQASRQVRVMQSEVPPASGQTNDEVELGSANIGTPAAAAGGIDMPSLRFAPGRLSVHRDADHEHEQPWDVLPDGGDVRPGGAALMPGHDSIRAMYINA